MTIRLTALACAVALVPFAANAQQQQMDQQPMGQQMMPHAMAQDGFFRAQQPDQVLGTNLMGVSVVGPADEEIGTVDDMLLDAEGRTIGIVVGIGGFLGIGEREVAIDVQQVQFVMVEAMTTGATAGTAPPAGRAEPVERTWDWGWGGWTTGRIEHVRVPFSQAQLEAAPEFTRLD